MTTQQITAKPFSLLRWFSILSLLVIVAISMASATLLSRFLRENLLQRDAVVTMEFVQSIAQAQNTNAYFAERDYSKSKAVLEDFFTRISHMPDVARANVYSVEKTVIWSNNEALVGKEFGDNPELDKALAGELVLESGNSNAGQKTEHVEFDESIDQFVENYIPVMDQDSGAVIGVVEVYKIPRVLFQSIEKGNRLVWISPALGGLFLYATLYWIVRHASIVIRQQQQALVDAEKFAMVGEMASAVAHGIRNPLGSIRTSAELAQEESSPPVKQYVSDIIGEADRLEGWVRELLVYSRHEVDMEQTVSIDDVIQTSLDSFSRRMKQHSVTVTLNTQDALPEVRGESILLVQVLNSLIANAMEAMPNGGQLQVIAEQQDQNVCVCVIDSGRGLSREKMREVFVPLVTHKPNGLGVGLSLARRILQRHGGGLDLISQEGRGSTARLQLPVAG